MTFEEGQNVTVQRPVKKHTSSHIEYDVIVVEDTGDLIYAKPAWDVLGGFDPKPTGYPRAWIKEADDVIAPHVTEEVDEKEEPVTDTDNPLPEPLPEPEPEPTAYGEDALPGPDEEKDSTTAYGEHAPQRETKTAYGEPGIGKATDEEILAVYEEEGRKIGKTHQRLKGRATYVRIRDLVKES